MKRNSALTLGVAVISIGLIAAITAVASSSVSRDGDPGSTAADKAGTLALYTWLGGLGFDVHRIGGSFSTDASDVVISVGPTEGYTAADADTVTRYVDHGGDLILAISPQTVAAVEPLLVRLGVRIGPASATGSASAAGPAHPVQPIDAGGRVASVALGAAVGFGESPTVVPLLYRGGDTVAVAVGGGGRGRVYVIGGAQPFTNSGLRDSGSAGFVLALLERSRNPTGPVLRIGFDEYHHGDNGTLGGNSSGAAAIFGGPLGLAIGLGFLVVIGWLAISGRRIGRPVPALDPRRVPSAGDYVTAMAQLHERSRLRGGIADRYGDELKHRVGRVTGVDAALSDGAFIHALTWHQPERVAAVRATLARARDLAAGRPTESRLVELAREVDSREAEWAATMRR